MQPAKGASSPSLVSHWAVLLLTVMVLWPRAAVTPANGNNISRHAYGYAPDGQVTLEERIPDGGASGSVLDNNTAGGPGTGTGNAYAYNIDHSVSIFDALYVVEDKPANAQGDSGATVGAPAAGAYGATYTYDGSGNRQTYVEKGVTTNYGADGENRYDYFLYDGDGNTTNSCVGWTYAYDDDSTGHIAIATSTDAFTDSGQGYYAYGHGSLGFEGLNGAWSVTPEDFAKYASFELPAGMEATINAYLDSVSPHGYATLPRISFDGSNSCASIVYKALTKAGLKIEYSDVPTQLWNNILAALKPYRICPLSDSKGKPIIHGGGTTNTNSSTATPAAFNMPAGDIEFGLEGPTTPAPGYQLDPNGSGVMVPISGASTGSQDTGQGASGSVDQNGVNQNPSGAGDPNGGDGQGG